MKRALSLALSVVFVFSAFCNFVLADWEQLPEIAEYTEKSGFFAEEKEAVEISESELSFRRTRQSFKQYLKQKLLDHEEIIELNGQEYNEETKKIIFELLLGDYEIMAYASIIPLTLYGEVVAIAPQYIFDNEEETIQAREDTYEKIQEYVNAVSDIPPDDVIGKILVIHDLFCKNNEYAYAEYKEEQASGKNNFDIRTAYYLFKNNKAVCQGNAMALKAIYDELNKQLKEEKGTNEDIIKTGLCESDYAEHIWNVVNVDGKWYHIDETNNDYQDYAIHNKFLVSSSALRESTSEEFYGDEKDWIYYCDEEIACDNDEYANGYIFNDFEDVIPLCRISYFSSSKNYVFEHPYYYKPFLTDGICATKALATDVYENEYGENETLLFVKDDTDAYTISARYDADGRLTGCNQESESLQGGALNQILPDSSYSHMFIWSKSNSEPLCRVIDIP